MSVKRKALSRAEIFRAMKWIDEHREDVQANHSTAMIPRLFTDTQVATNPSQYSRLCLDSGIVRRAQPKANGQSLRRLQERVDFIYSQLGIDQNLPVIRARLTPHE